MAITLTNTVPSLKKRPFLLIYLLKQKRLQNILLTCFNYREIGSKDLERFFNHHLLKQFNSTVPVYKEEQAVDNGTNKKS